MSFTASISATKRVHSVKGDDRNMRQFSSKADEIAGKTSSGARLVDRRSAGQLFESNDGSKLFAAKPNDSW
jgi:hypothetical protein